MREIANFLKTLKHRINYLIDLEEKWDIIFVMGNVSCDLDSVSSSIVYAFMKNLECGLLTVNSTTELEYNVKETGNKIYIPVINCAELEFFWRLDIAELLKRMGLSEMDFFYFADVFDQFNKVIVFSALKSKLITFNILFYLLIIKDLMSIITMKSYLWIIMS